VREIVVWVCTILTVGILRLVFYWRPDWMLKCTCVVESLDKAEYVLLEVRSCLRCKVCWLSFFFESVVNFFISAANA